MEDLKIKDLLSRDQAIAYLREKWGPKFANWSEDSFKHYRLKHGIRPILGAYFTKEQLDSLPMPDRSKSRPGRRKKSQQAGGEDMHHRCTFRVNSPNRRSPAHQVA